MSGITEALCAAQAEFPQIEKTKPVKVTMKSGGTYTFYYAPLDEVRAKTLPSLNKHGLSITQFLSHVDGAASLTTTLFHTNGDKISETFPLPVREGMSAQEIGSLITYLRRYAWVSALGLATEEDDDGNHASGNSVSRAAVVASPPPGTAAAAGATAATVEPVSPPAPVAAPASSFKAPDVAGTPLNQPVEVGSNSKGTLYRVTTDVKHISEATGEKNGKAWTRFDVHLVIAGGEEITLATFSDTLVGKCRQLAGTTAHITFVEKQNGRYLNRTLEDIEQADMDVAAEAISQAAAGFPVDDGIPFAAVIW